MYNIMDIVMREDIDNVLRVNFKTKNSDFLVNEIPLPQAFKDGRVHIYTLKKSGLSTNEAIQKIAKYADFSVESIGYSGLKDEEGITTQLISMPIIFSIKQLYEINNISTEMELLYQGSTDEELSIGMLLGNSFKITVRNISNSLAEKLSFFSSHRSMYINFYGPQRFGRPGLKKNTHVIGEHLINKRHKEALDLLIEQFQSKCLTSDMPAEYFEKIDPRQLAFYLNSYYSYKWNDDLQKKIIQQFGKKIQFECESIPYTYIKERSNKFKFLSNVNEQKIIKYRVKDRSPVELCSSRQTFVYTEIFVSNIKDDALNLGMKCADLSFFLPTGSYATVILPQFLYEIC